jgi:AraC-like DNA-binding protein
MSACPTCGHPHAFDVLGWLEGRGVRLAPAAAYGMRHLFEHAGELVSVEAWSEAARVSPTTLRGWCRKKRIPSAGRWLALARGLHMAGEIRDSSRSVERVGFALGYDGHSAVSHHIRRTFGVSVSEARSCTAETLADHWWSRHASPSTARRAA